MHHHAAKDAAANWRSDADSSPAASSRRSFAGGHAGASCADRTDRTAPRSFHAKKPHMKTLQRHPCREETAAFWRVKAALSGVLIATQNAHVVSSTDCPVPHTRPKRLGSSTRFANKTQTARPTNKKTEYNAKAAEVFDPALQTKLKPPRPTNKKRDNSKAAGVFDPLYKQNSNRPAPQTKKPSTTPRRLLRNKQITGAANLRRIASA